MRLPTSAISKRRVMPGTHYSRACIPSKHPIKYSRCITANIGLLRRTIRCDRLTHTVGKPRICFVHFAALPISRLIVRRGHTTAERTGERWNRGCRGTAHERLVRRRRERGDSSPGWQTDRGKREPPKLDYSCRTTLNGVTHVRDDSAGGRRYHMVAGHVPFHFDRMNGRTCGALRSPEVSI